MLKELIVCSFHLRVGDHVLYGGKYLVVRELKGTFVPYRGLMVDMLLDDGWHRLDIMENVRVYRHE